MNRTKKLEPYREITFLAFGKETSSEESALVHQAMRIVVHPINPANGNDFSGLKLLRFHCGAAISSNAGNPVHRLGRHIWITNEGRCSLRIASHTGSCPALPLDFS